MVQILPAAQRNPTFAQKLSAGVGRSLEMGSQMMKEHQQHEALKKFGIPEELAELSPELQSLYFKSQFTPEKGLTPLQEAQKKLAEERLAALQSQQSLFNELLTPGKKSESIEGISKPSEPTNQDQGIIRNISNENLQKLSAFAGQPGKEGIVGNMAKAELDRKKQEEDIKRKEFHEERAYHTQFSKPLEEKVNLMRSSLPKQENALNLARSAIESGDIGAFTMNHIADVTGFDSLRNAKGAQLILAAKEQLLPTLGRIGAKAQNLYMEKRMASMIPQIGQRDEANLTMQEMLEGEAYLDRAYLNEFDRLSDEDDKKYGFVRKDIDKRVHSSIKHLEDEIAKRTSFKLREIEENQMGLSDLKKIVGKNVIKGTPLTLAMMKLYGDKFGDDAIQVAEKNGYYVPSLEEYKIFQYRPQEFREEVLQ